MKLVLIVKGDRHQAARAASARGIPFAFIREARGDTIGTCGEQFRDKVADWYGEPPHIAPHPAGALLLFKDA